MANVKLTRREWIDAALALAGERGIDAVRVEPLARRLGVTKGSFYGYFSSLDAFLAEVLAVWEDDVTAGVLAQLDNAKEPRARIRELALALVAHPNRTIGTELAIRAWAGRDPNVATVVARVQSEQERLLRDTFGEFVDGAEADYRTLVAMSVRLATPFLEETHEGAAERIAFVVERLVR